MRGSGIAVCVLTACLVMSACGGGGGGDDGQPQGVALLSGQYHLFRLSGTIGTDHLTSIWGTQSSGGAGNLSAGTATTNEVTMVSGPAPVADVTYDITADRTFTLIGPEVRGGISSSGALAAAADLRSGQDPQTAIFLRRDGNFTVASLNGVYNMVVFEFVSGSRRGVFGSVTFDGSGGLQLAADTVNDEGSGGAPFNGTGTYTVSAEGDLTLNLTGSGAPDLRGGILADGSLAILGGSSTNGEGPTQMLLLRQATSAGLGTLSGSYFAIGFAGATGESAVGSGSLTKNEPDGITYLGDANVDGTPSASPTSSTGTYVVGTDGLLKLTIDSFEFEGAITQSGEFAAWMGPTSTVAPQVFLLIRK